MLVLDGGRAMRFLVGALEALGYRWAYRLVDSRFTGVPQRRQRVILLASLDDDPRDVLFSDDAGEPDTSHFRSDAFGFYWTEGLRGLGWARDAVPTLKGGSTIGIPSPPAIWNPGGRMGRRIVTPTLVEAEQMQGFDPGWTSSADSVSTRKGTRWKLVGKCRDRGRFEMGGLSTPSSSGFRGRGPSSPRRSTLAASVLRSQGPALVRRGFDVADRRAISTSQRTG